MIETYYVRRSADSKVTSLDTTIVQDSSALVTRMSTPDRTEALCSGAESAILNPGYYYFVYENNRQIAKFVVVKEN